MTIGTPGRATFVSPMFILCLAAALSACGDKDSGGAESGGDKDSGTNKLETDTAKTPVDTTGMPADTASTPADIQAKVDVELAADNDEPPDTAGTAHCKTLDEVGCAADAACTALTAWVPEIDGYCAGKTSQPTFRGCVSGAMTCGAMITCASHLESSVRAVFPTTCLPKGWNAEKPSICCPPTTGACPLGTETKVVGFCIRAAKGSKQLQPGQPAYIHMQPEGCHSSSCTNILSASCGLDTKSAIWTLQPLLCTHGFASIHISCSTDCNGADPPPCATPRLTAGTHHVALGALKLSFEATATTSGGGLCVSQQVK